MHIPGDMIFPPSLCVRLTRACNARCAFCQAPANDGGVLSASFMERLAAKVEPIGVKSIKLSGGEPTLRRDLPEIIQIIQSKGMRPTIITNGLKITEEVITAISKAGEVKFSIHKPGIQNMDVLGCGNYSILISNIRKLSLKKVKISMNVVLTHDNKDCIKDLVDFAVSEKFSKISFIPVVNRGKASFETKQFNLSAEEIKVIKSEIRNVGSKFNTIKVNIIDLRLTPYWIIENDGSLWVERSNEREDSKLMDTHTMKRWIEHA